MHKIPAFVIAFLTVGLTLAQKPKTYTSSEIYEKIQKLNFLGTVLYVAAHPDDENTGLLSYLSNDVKARTGYLSLTRGDGGQNLIGTELREMLGVLRTQELLAARRIDGGEQFFTRANDFGFSKHPDETLEFWNEDQVMSDIIWTIRNFQPDIVINRFDHRSPGTTHGHHTTSAILSVAAFDKSGKRDAYPEQLTYVDMWQPQRLFFNTSWWFYGSKEKFDSADKSNLVSVNTGVYYPMKGLSNGEIAALSRSQHKCQGFGTAGTRGESTEYLELLKGDLPKGQQDIFEGINTSWTRVLGGKAIGDILTKVEQNFDFKNPEKHLNDLLKAYELIKNLGDHYWRDYKLRQIEEIIQTCCGLYITVNSSEEYTTPDSDITINLEITNRSHQNIQFLSASINSIPENKHEYKEVLAYNKFNNYSITLNTGHITDYNTPYWLKEEGTLGMYAVKNKALIGMPESPAPFTATIELLINNVPVTFHKSVIYKKVMPDKGEVYQPFYILPQATVNILNDVIVFSESKSKEVEVIVKAGKNTIAGNVSLSVPEGWKVTPASIPFQIAQKDDVQKVTFSVTPPEKESVGSVLPVVTMNGDTYSDKLVTIDYDHIPKQFVLLPATTRVVRLNISTSGNAIGYIAGAGDKIPESLTEIGYNVTVLNPETITAENLANFDAVVIGIRAYNVVNTLPYKQPFLEEYAKNGGTVIVQYNTNRGLITDHITPFDLHLSGDRVTDENAAVTILAKDHPALNYPNKITETDFEGWTQERGLYFPDTWGSEFTPILSMQDKGEAEKKGSLLVAKYGKGYYIYTGLSFFRELPAGVPGAFKLFTNLISIGKSNLRTDKIKG